MEESYRFIRISRIREPSISQLRINQFILKLFIRNPAETRCRISFLRIIVEGVSVPARLGMEESYRFIRISRIRGLSISQLRINQFTLKLFIRNPAETRYRISFLRIIAGTSPSPRDSEWKNLTDIYAIPQKYSTGFQFCV